MFPPHSVHTFHDHSSSAHLKALGEDNCALIDEMRAVSEISNLKLSEICLLHLVYELYSGCTAILMNSSIHGEAAGPFLARTLDWDMSVTHRVGAGSQSWCTVTNAHTVHT